MFSLGARAFSYAEKSLLVSACYAKLRKKPNEIQELKENGFEYICDQEDLKFFRKRKQSVAGLCKKSIVVPRAGFEPETNGEVSRTTPLFLFPVSRAR